MENNLSWKYFNNFKKNVEIDGEQTKGAFAWKISSKWKKKNKHSTWVPEEKFIIGKNTYYVINYTQTRNVKGAITRSGYLMQLNWDTLVWMETHEDKEGKLSIGGMRFFNVRLSCSNRVFRCPDRKKGDKGPFLVSMLSSAKSNNLTVTEEQKNAFLKPIQEYAKATEVPNATRAYYKRIYNI